MKIKFTTAFFLSLQTTYGKKAPEVLFQTISEVQKDWEPLEWESDEYTITDETITQYLGKKNQRKMERVMVAQRVIEFFNQTTEKNFKNTDTNLTLVTSLLEAGYTEEDIKLVIVNKTEQWLGSEHLEHFLRPATIFRKSNFDNYVNEPMSKKAGEKKLATELDKLLAKAN